MVADFARSSVTFLDDRTLTATGHTQLQLRTGIRWPSVVGFSEQSIIAINGQVFENGQLGIGVIRPPFVFLRFALDGTLKDTLVTAPGTEFFVPNDHRTRPTQAIPFGTTVLHAVTPSRLFLTETNGGRINQVRAGETLQEFASIPVRHVPISRADIARSKEERVAAATNDAQKRLAALLDHVPFPKEFPISDQMLLSAEGEIWIRRHQPAAHRSQQWVTVNESGKTQCTAQLPAGLRVLDVSRDHLLAVTTDSDGEEKIRVYPFLRTGTSR